MYRIKRRAELDYLKAIIKFHHRDIDRLQKEQKQNVKNPISTQSASRSNVTELDVTKFQRLKQELQELKQLLKGKSVLTIKQEEKYQSLNIKSINANKPSSHKKPNKIPENK